MRYKIGDVAKILGISPDLLRYYEKKGVVKPVKDRNNDYRYYEAWDINFLIDCLWYKQFGYGLEQVAKIVSQSTYQDILGTIEDKDAELEATIRHQEMLLKRLRQHREEVSRAKALLGKCDLVYSPEIVRYLNRYNGDYDKSAETQQLSHQWLQYMPFTHRCFEICQKDLEDKTDNYAWGFSLTMDYVEELQVPVTPPAIHLPSEPSVHSVFTSSGKDAFSPRHMKFLMDYVRAHGYTVSGNARGNLLCSVLEDDQLTGYFEVWLPIHLEPGMGLNEQQ
jgi:DNA-binding transcriptional MerR regulator